MDRTNYDISCTNQHQQWECACSLTQQGLLSMLIQMESKVAMKQWPTMMGTEAQARHYGMPMIPLDFGKFQMENVVHDVIS